MFPNSMVWGVELPGLLNSPLLRQGVGQGGGPLGGSLMRRVMIGAGGWGMIGAQPIKARKFKCFAQRALAFQPLHPDVHTVDLELPASSVQI